MGFIHMTLYMIALYKIEPYQKWLREMAPNRAREVFGHIESVKILVILNSTDYMLTSSTFAFIQLRHIL